MLNDMIQKGIEYCKNRPSSTKTELVEYIAMYYNEDIKYILGVWDEIAKDQSTTIGREVHEGIATWDGGYSCGSYYIGDTTSNDMFKNLEGCEVRVTIEVLRTREQVEASNYLEANEE